MNTKKGKGKNRPNKPPNPNPPQKQEVAQAPEKVEEPVIENVESELKFEERVPEIVSDVVTPSEEVKSVEEPKKPKRNRGKKKKHDKDESDEFGDITGDNNTGQKCEEEVKLARPVEESKDKGKTEEPKEESASVMPVVLPDLAISTKSKKKGKKDFLEPTSKVTEDVVKSEEPKQSLPVDVSEFNVVMHADETSKPAEESKTSKKKNKKKKRHDSEKSDKGEEISCTTAFQELLGVEEEKKLSEAETKTETIIDSTSLLQEEVVDSASIETASKSNKNKKKGKKDKNKPDVKEEVHHKEESATKIETDNSAKEEAENIIKESLVDSKIVSESKAPEDIKSATEDVKHKAKIAKPVDKKRKEKSNQALKEGELTENVTLTEMSTTEKIKGYDDDNLTKQTEDSALLLPEKVSQSEDVTTMSSENISLTPSEKKRKKSPKPPPKQQHDVTKDSKKTEKKDFGTLETPTSEEAQEKITIMETPKHKILETPIEKQIEPKFTKETEPHAATSTANLEVKSGKKRKKSPKPLSNLEISDNKTQDVKNKQSTVETEPPIPPVEIFETPMQTKNEEGSDVFCDMPLMEDIEISSVKADESEGSIPEITPDIQYPRAASQQRVDDNNNTIIREVVSPSDVKLGIPVFVPDTPFIQGENISLTSPDLVASGIRVVDVEANVVKPSEEKTDIKSKMMEVNQDMEELRLSIERSLAELTSIEKSEQNLERQYDNKHKNEEPQSSPADKSTSELESKIIGEESQTTESPILMIHKKPLEAIMPAPSPPPKHNKKDKLKTENVGNPSLPVIPLPPPLPKEVLEPITEEIKPLDTAKSSDVAPVCPARKDNKGKGKSKKKGKQEAGQSTASESISSTEPQSSKECSQDTKKEEKKEQKPDSSQSDTKKQSDSSNDNQNKTGISESEVTNQHSEFEPIESFEDAMTSSADDVNQTFEIIASETSGSHVNPEINITAPSEEQKTEPKDEKQNPVTPPKNLLGHPVIPVRSNKMDYKKEKNKTPNTILAKVKIKDAIEIDSRKQSKESQTDNIKKLMKKKSIDESISTLNENEEFVYKYSFRKVFLPNVCHVCKRELKPMRVSCNFCHLLFYCNQKHKDEDWPQHQAFCFAVSTIVHLKDQKHIYEDAASVTGHSYRLLRMQMIVSCEKILKRKLVPWEQEALLYPRLCGDVECREWRINKLADCNGCGQIAYCSTNPDHLPRSHQHWCKSYSLYQKLVCYQQTRGRLEPKLPSRVMSGPYQIPDKINEVLAAMYEEKIDMSDVEYAALTQLATAPLTAVYSYQLYTNKMNSIYANGTYKKTSFTIHVVGAELQFEADALNKWEIFFLHLRPDIIELRVALIAPDLNPSNLPLDLLGKIKLCEQCRQDKRRLLFSFQDRKTYSDYYRSDEFITPDIVCAFNPSIQRSSVYNGKDPWPSTISCILKQKVPFIITSYTIDELRRDLSRVKECADYNTISDPKYNNFASVRPDRNFITDDEIPLLFKNYCFAVVSGVF
ncbi:titin [Amyelois transitella]|uniref:titin n=1 Tax=Amyelois transitella TaxID=680683 RepID=UPI00067BB4C1|nr:titin [Amyelois transitella]